MKNSLLIISAFTFLIMVSPILAISDDAHEVHHMKSVEDFQFIGPSTTMQQVIAKLGKPDTNLGSGINIYEYHLSDGTDILIGSPDGSQILYVSHGKEKIFEKK